MNEIQAALILREMRPGAQARRPTHHTHRARVFRMSRPGLTGTLAQLPGDARMSVVWRSSR